MNLDIEPIFFETSTDFRNWLSENYKSASELFVGFYKVKSGKKSITWSESVDQALCFGWIDSIRKSIDHESYCIRFSPRRPTSIWSEVNIQKVEKLSMQGLMLPEGLISFNLRKENKSKIYTYETKVLKLPAAFEKRFKANEKAWKFFQLQTPSYCKTTIKWILSAKQEQTREKRLEELIADSQASLKIKPLRTRRD